MSSLAGIGDRKIRFALVGCGRISKNHIEALAGFPDAAEIVDVCDVVPAAAEATAAVCGARPHSSLDTMLTQTDADAVILTTPSGLHAGQAIMVAQSGRHVVTEKPMATRWADGLRMLEACDLAGVNLFVVKQNRQNATLQLLKRAIDGGRFGRIYMVAVNVFWTRPQEYYDAAPWRGTWELDGGALMNQASHYVDLLDWLIGPIESVHAYTATLARSIEAEDTAALGIKWRSGALGTMSVTMLSWPRNLEGSITVLGQTGTARIGGIAVNEIQTWEFAEPHPDDEQIRAASYDTGSVYGFGHQSYYRNVIETLRGEARPQTDGRQGLRSLEVLVAAYRSSRDGVRVNLPLERG